MTPYDTHRVEVAEPARGALVEAGGRADVARRAVAVLEAVGGVEERVAVLAEPRGRYS